MAKPAITFRSTKGSPLTYTELDTNFDNLQDATIGFTVGGTNADIDLNSRLTVAAGDNVTLTLVGTTLTIAASGGATGNFVTTDTTQTITADKTFTGAVTTNDIQVNNEIFGPDFVSGTSTLNELTLYPDDNSSPKEVYVKIKNSYTTTAPFHNIGSVEFKTYSSGLSREYKMLGATFQIPGRIQFNGGTSITDYDIDNANTINAERLVLGADSDYQIRFNDVPSLTGVKNVLGYIRVNVNGQDRHLPYYSDTTPSPGSQYVEDLSGTAASYANNATVDFANFSGMIMVNRQDGGSGNVALWIVGSGTTLKLGDSNGDQSGTIAANGGINGYRWTNNTGGTITATFAAIRTRNAG